MGRALVIKNANFSENKVTTVTFNDVPCTGVSFESDTVSFSGTGEVTIDYTLTPSNTTDPVLFESSDQDVLSVTGTTLEVVGIGTCDLTIKCGRFIATCSVTVDIYEEPNVFVGYESVATSESDPTVQGVLLSGNSNRLIAVKNIDDTSFTNMIVTASPKYTMEDITAIEIPNNTDKIHISAKNLYSSNAVTVRFMDTEQIFAYGGKNFMAMISTVILPQTAARTVDEDVPVPSGVNAYIIDFRPYSNETAEFASEAQAKAYLAETLEASIHYLPAET